MRWYFIPTVLIAIVAWRSSHAINSAFRPIKLPVEYFASSGHHNADATKHCEVLHAPDGALAYCEDQTFWDFEDAEGIVVERKLVASCDPNRKSWNTVMGPLKDPNPRGALWLIEFDKSKVAVPKKIDLEGYPKGKDFHPLGVDIWPSVAGSTSNMFVVNHGRHNTTIEQFMLDPSKPEKAKFVRTITSKYFIAPNALALTSPTSFFVTNDHLMTRRLPSILGKTFPVIETLLALPFGSVAHVSIINDAVPGAAIIRHTHPRLGIPFANGVALSPDGRTLAVASSTLAQVFLFNRTTPTNGTARESLELLHTVQTPFAPDNVVYDSSGALIVAGHPFYPALIQIAANKTGILSPSWVVEIKDREEGKPPVAQYDQRAPFSASKKARASKSHEMTTIYQGDGSKFGGSTTGLRDMRTDTVFISGLYQEGLLICRP